jgi:tRNA-uridine 2-sulfurtransferase
VIKETKKVYVGLSGGVDSSVAALLLKKDGYEVTGVFIKAWYPDFINCNWREEMRDAMRVCAKLDIPFKICDLEKEYKKEVVDYLISEYEKGRTPNPDVMCNKYIKFDGFLNFAISEGADFVATGHYAQNIFSNNQFNLTNAADSNKDQTYFLWTLSKAKLSKILFPIGHLNKNEVRKIAQKNNLFTSAKKDSQGLCFLGHVDIENFLSHFVKTEAGNVLDTDNKIIGKHRGALFYTIGQRHGFEINENDNNRDKYYVISKNLEQNTLTVSENKSDESFIKKEYLVSDLNIINNLPEEINCLYRYRGELKEIKIEKTKDKEAKINFKDLNENIAPGQSIVFYLDGVCLGGATIY